MKKTDDSFQEAFIREVDEDLKNESMKKLWDKYGLYVILIVVVSLTIAVSFEGIKNWYAHKLETRADTYAYALSMQNLGKYQESKDNLDYIITHDYGIFTDLAKLQKANVLFDEGKTDEALKLLEALAHDNKLTPQLRDAAVIKLASYKLDKAPAEEVNSLIEGLANDPANKWNPIAREMQAILVLREGNAGAAKEMYEQLLQDEDTPESMKSRIKDIISVL